jgi:hypothetical protein
MEGLSDVKAGVWIEFRDRNGTGFAQPDFFLPGPHSVLVFESKLTETDGGYSQIAALYRPLLRHIYQRPVVGILVCKTLIRRPDRLISAPAELLDTTEEATYLWHFLG